MARQIIRRPGEDAKLPDQFPGAAGPWMANDKAELHHASTEAQEWLLRLSDKDIVELEANLQFVSRFRAVIKWAKRLSFGVVGGFTAVYAAGEKMYRLAYAIGSVIADPSSVLTVLKGLFG